MDSDFFLQPEDQIQGYILSIEAYLQKLKETRFNNKQANKHKRALLSLQSCSDFDHPQSRQVNLIEGGITKQETAESKAAEIKMD